MRCRCGDCQLPGEGKLCPHTDTDTHAQTSEKNLILIKIFDFQPLLKQKNRDKRIIVQNSILQWCLCFVSCYKSSTPLTVTAVHLLPLPNSLPQAQLKPGMLSSVRGSEINLCQTPWILTHASAWSSERGLESHIAAIAIVFQLNCSKTSWTST